MSLWRAAIRSRRGEPLRDYETVGHPGIQVQITLPILIFSFADPSWCFGMPGFLIRRRSLLGSLAEAVDENVILGCLGQPPW